MNNTRDITRDNEKKENKALRTDLSGGVGLINGKRPRQAETNQHDNFKKTQNKASFKY